MAAASTLRRDTLVAGLLALLLGLAWTWRGWAELSELRLPDTDDVVRLQQIRDWLGGQPFADLTQHRLGGGVPMHWSRLPDLVPAAMIALSAPLLGTHSAEMLAVIAWPLLLFALALLLVARIARALGDDIRGGDTPAITALIVAAIGYPATTLFLPGRIDHHGLQMVLLLGATLSLLKPATITTGVATGLLAAASLVIGLETAPLLAAIGGIAAIDWVLTRDGATKRLWGLGLGALIGLAAARAAFATSASSYPACDGFTGQAWRAAMAVAPAPLALALLDGHLPGRRSRAAAAILVAAVAGGVALLVSPGCLHPYGGVDPVMTRLWLDQVGEAQSPFSAPVGTTLGYTGLMLAGMVASLWRLHATRARGWAVLLALQLAAAAITLVELRGAYAGALLAAPALAAAIGAARARDSLSLAGAWIASAGMLYPLAAHAFISGPAARPAAQGDCASPAMLDALGRLPTGTVVAPIDAGAYLLAGTRQGVVAAPYHRNGAGNLAAYRFYLGDAAMAQATARRWHVTYALSCATMPGPRRAAGLPGWRRLATMPDGAVIWAP